MPQQSPTTNAESTDPTMPLHEAGGLRVDTAPLDAILSELQAKTSYHEKQISRLQDIERIQSQLQKDSNRLSLRLSSAESFRLVAGTTNSSTCNGEGGDEEATDGGIDDEPPSSDANNTSCTSRPSSLSSPERLGWARVQGVVLAQQCEEKASATLRQLQKELVGIKAVVQQLQGEHDDELASSMQADDCIASLKDEVLQLQRDVSSCATFKQIREVQATIQQVQKDTERYVGDHQNEFRSEIDGSIQKKLVEIKSWFRELETLMKQRQAKLDARMASVAKASDLTTLQDSVEIDAAEARERLDVLTETTDAATTTLETMRYQMAFSVLSNLRRRWARQILRRAWTSWVAWQKKANEARSRFLLQSRLTRKILKQIMLRKKRLGFAMWVEVVNWQRRIEARKEAALQLMQQRITRAITEPTQEAFNHWRRLVLIEKINAAYNHTNSTSQNIEKHDSTLSGLSQVLETLKNDAHGSAQALAQEIKNLRNHDIGGLRTDWDQEKTKQAERINEISSASLAQLTSRHEKFEGRVKSNIEEISKQLPHIKSDVDGLQMSHSEISDRIASVEEGHGERIKLCSERNDLLDERLQQLESRLVKADERIRALEEDKEKSNEAIDTLLRRMEASERRHEANGKELQNIVRRFAAENNELRQSLQNSQSVQTALRDVLDVTQSRLDKHTSCTQNALDRIRGTLDAHGVRKPKLVKMIELCVLYEKTAKEKNYVVTIDTVFDGNEPANLPDHIAAFAHDYAAWIAYQADHEIMLRVISGSNPQDLVYADDDLGPRRCELLESLKTDLCLALGAVHPEAGVLKLEARTRFIARLMEAADSALSKHDQIVIETNSRIGKLRSSTKSVPVCVACDRPLRSKGRSGKSRASHASTSSGGGGGQEQGPAQTEPYGTTEGAELIVGTTGMEQDTPKKSNQRQGRAFGTTQQPQYTMKCGFRMPLPGSDVSPPDGENDDTNAVQEETVVAAADIDVNDADAAGAEENVVPNRKPKAVLRQMSLP